MKTWFHLFAPAAFLLLILTACNPAPPPVSGHSNPNQAAPAEWVFPVETIDTSDMNVYWQSEYFYFAADENAKVSLYVQAEKYEDAFMFDDGQDWLLVMETAFGIYPLFPRSYVQIGMVNYTLFYDESGILHVLVTVGTTAGYQIYDCLFDNDKKAFEIVPVYNAVNINNFGGSR